MAWDWRCDLSGSGLVIASMFEQAGRYAFRRPKREADVLRVLIEHYEESGTGLNPEGVAEKLGFRRPIEHIHMTLGTMQVLELRKLCVGTRVKGEMTTFVPTPKGQGVFRYLPHM